MTKPRRLLFGLKFHRIETKSAFHQMCIYVWSQLWPLEKRKCRIRWAGIFTHKWGIKELWTLHITCKNHQVDVLKILVHAGTLVSQGWTIYSLPVRRADIELIFPLFLNSLKISMRPRQGQTGGNKRRHPCKWLCSSLFIEAIQFCSNTWVLCSLRGYSCHCHFKTRSWKFLIEKWILSCCVFTSDFFCHTFSPQFDCRDFLGTRWTQQQCNFHVLRNQQTLSLVSAATYHIWWICSKRQCVHVRKQCFGVTKRLAPFGTSVSAVEMSFDFVLYHCAMATRAKNMSNWTRPNLQKAKSRVWLTAKRQKQNLFLWRKPRSNGAQTLPSAGTRKISITGGSEVIQNANSFNDGALDLLDQLRVQPNCDS